jgi:hypothetical protein
VPESSRKKKIELKMRKWKMEQTADNRDMQLTQVFIVSTQPIENENDSTEWWNFAVRGIGSPPLRKDVQSCL